MASPIPNSLSQSNPTLIVKEIQDIYIRKNFDNLVSYFSNQNQFLNFKFFEFSFAEAESNKRFSHGLGFTPKDIVVLHCTGEGSFTFNVGLCDNENGDISVSGPCNVRFFIGSYWQAQNPKFSVPKEESMTFFGNSNSSSNFLTTSVNQVTLPLSLTELASGTYGKQNPNIGAYIVQPTDDVIYITPPASGFSVTLPSASTCKGKVYTICKLDNTFNIVTINVAGNTKDCFNRPYPLIRSAIPQPPMLGTTPVTATVTSTTLNTYLEQVVIVSTGSGWYIMDRTYYEGPILFNAQIVTTGTQITLGNGSLLGTFWRKGQNIHVHMSFTFGSTTNPGTGVYNFVVPNVLLDTTGFIRSPTDNYYSLGQWTYHDVGAFVFWGSVTNSDALQDSVYCRIVSQGGPGFGFTNAVNAGGPSIPAAGDCIHLNYEYPVLGWNG